MVKRRESSCTNKLQDLRLNNKPVQTRINIFDVVFLNLFICLTSRVHIISILFSFFFWGETVVSPFFILSIYCFASITMLAISHHFFYIFKAIVLAQLLVSIRFIFFVIAVFKGYFHHFIHNFKFSSPLH